MREIVQKLDRPPSSTGDNSAEKAHLLLERQPLTEESASLETRDPLHMAESVLSAAWEASGTRRADLAREALEISEDCADAYVILAEETARSLEDARRLYQEGVKAGERALGMGGSGDAHQALKTTPRFQSYIRARTGLARCLWSMGKRRDAIAHCAEILHLNPSDEQLVRHLLANWLLHEELGEDLENLLETFKDDRATPWLYTRALWAFSQGGTCPKADEYLQEAFRQNPYVPSYLLGLKKMPGILPEHVEAGDEREAVSYIAEALNTWLRTEGSLEWLIMSLPRAIDRTR